MDFLKEWITNIILFVLLATVIDMLLPNSSMQKYTKMVAGLLLIGIILSPVLKLVSNDFEAALAAIPGIKTSEEKNMEKLIELQKKEIQASHRAYILEQMAVQLKKDAEEELMDQYGLEIADIDLRVDENSKSDFPENLKSIVVHLKDPGKEAEAVAVVKKVEINTKQPLPSKDQEDENSKKIASLLYEKWDVQPAKVEIVVEGGNT